MRYFSCTRDSEPVGRKNKAHQHNRKEVGRTMWKHELQDKHSPMHIFPIVDTQMLRLL